MSALHPQKRHVPGQVGVVSPVCPRRSARTAPLPNLEPPPPGVRENMPAGPSAAHSTHCSQAAGNTRTGTLALRVRYRKRCTERLAEGVANGTPRPPAFQCFQSQACRAPRSGRALRPAVPPVTRAGGLRAHAPVDLPCCNAPSGTADVHGAACVRPPAVPPVACARGPQWPRSPPKVPSRCASGAAAAVQHPGNRRRVNPV